MFSASITGKRGPAYVILAKVPLTTVIDFSKKLIGLQFAYCDQSNLQFAQIQPKQPRKRRQSRELRGFLQFAACPETQLTAPGRPALAAEVTTRFETAAKAAAAMNRLKCRV